MGDITKWCRLRCSLRKATTLQSLIGRPSILIEARLLPIRAVQYCGHGYTTTLCCLFSLALLYTIYVADLQSNPPGFYIDESSISYNAYTICRTGRDEHGKAWPIYFHAFESGNPECGWYAIREPLYVYLLALLFRLMGPSIMVARLFSATLGFLAALLLALIALRLYRSRFIAIFVGLTALFTPWLFELSRLVFEVALLPATLALSLLALHRGYAKRKWSAFDCIAIAFTLGLFTYTYTACRLLGPLLALGLICFVTREGWTRIVQALIAYAIMLLPLLVFVINSPGALTRRFHDETYIKPDSTAIEIVSQFIAQYISNLSPLALLLDGDPNQRHHLGGMGSMLIVPLLIAAAGIVIVLKRHRRDPWWRFLLYGLAISIVPASLTNDTSHALRLAACPVFLLLFMTPALALIAANAKAGTGLQKALIIMTGVTLLQAIIFQQQYHREGAKRVLDFDADYPDVFGVAIATSSMPIHFIDNSYAHAYWYGMLQGVDTSRFIRVRCDEEPPKGSVIVSYRNGVEKGVIAAAGDFVAYIATDE